MATTVTKTGDTVDLVCWRLFGQTLGLTEALFQLNPILRNQPLVLPRGLTLTLPDPAAVTPPPTTIALWT